MPKAVVEKVTTLAEFGFANRQSLNLNHNAIVPRDLLVKLMESFVPPITSFLQPGHQQAPNWVKEIVTEVKGTKAGEAVIYRIGTLMTRGPLPTGVAPARGAVWQAEGSIPAGVFPPELVFDAERFLKELEEREIYTFVTKTQAL